VFFYLILCFNIILDISNMLNSILLFGGLGPTEIIILFVIVLLLFGGRKIPELMRGVGKGISEFKQGVKDPTDNSEKEEKK